ncbi:hypothetical protein [Estrella lausannensis]|uniref:Uncharacterized protein n=1 Tax=Estrella lausannensis TaxID=483423 RepID=A0A0H5E4Y5_9BACT|nr:hypothetical protein [Estrella lausannensis]CRX38305.1 hypothetical protein ELAC_0959 [Estrella lausannensis]
MQEMQSASPLSPTFYTPECSYPGPVEVPERVSCNLIESNSSRLNSRGWISFDTPQQILGRQKIQDVCAALYQMPAAKDRQMSAAEDPLILKTLQKPQAQDITKIVWTFMHLFIDRKITPEEEPKDRITLSHVLIQFFRKNYTLAPNVVPEILNYAITCYAYVAANGFYKHMQDKYPIPLCIAPYQKDASILYTALYDGLTIDFPDYNFDTDYVESMGMSALIYVNDIRRNQQKSLGEVFFQRKNLT